MTRSSFQCRVCGVGVEDATLWRENAKDQPGIWSCTKHRGRHHCVAPSCRRTFAPKGEAFDLEVEVVCGRHWRLAPQCLRQIYSRIRRQAKRYGWNDELIARERRNWDRIKRMIAAPSINAELARLGL